MAKHRTHVIEALRAFVQHIVFNHGAHHASSSFWSQGEVLAVGPGRTSEQGNVIPLAIAAGDTVVYSKYGGTEITVEGEDLLILSSRDVLAVLK